MSPYVSMWSVYMSPCGYGHGVSPCVHVDMDLKIFYISMCLWIWRVSMFPCVSISYVDMDMECLYMSPCLQGNMSME